jgi:hypothetical protein
MNIESQMSSPPGHTAVKHLHLCSRCATSGVSTLLRRQTDAVAEDEPIDCILGPPSSWNIEDCQLCHFLFQCLPQSYQKDCSHDAVIHLVSQSREETTEELGVILRSLNHGELKQRSMALECYRSASTAKASHSLIVLLHDRQWSDNKPTSSIIDFSMLSGWLNNPIPDCSYAHSRRKALGSNRSASGKPSRTGSWETARHRVLAMELDVINCTTRRVVRLPVDEQYVTLSYVWGRPSGDIRRGTPRRPDSVRGSLRLAVTDEDDNQDKSTPLPTKLPLTIEDSISVCKALDYRYLWIDRYCIPQKDREMRNRQIQQMDDIYCGSALTIIACAGSGPQYGLPGVSKPRVPCPSFHTGGSEYLQMIPTVHDIYSSTWGSRAWTYQEALLAQRRLFFTDRQVYFESKDMVESELTTLVPVVTRVLDPRIYSQVTSSTFPGDIHKCIQEYTRRDLSFQSDVMNALLGILTYYGREHGILHLWGIPFSANTPASIDEPPRKRVITFEESLCWYPTSQHSRREGFPSWSWAGCMSTVTWDIWRHDSRPATAPFKQGEVFIELELNSGELITWAEYLERYAKFNNTAGQDRLSRFLHIETYTSSLTNTYNSTNTSESVEWNTLCLETIDGNQSFTLDLFTNPARSLDNLIPTLVGSAESFQALHLSNWQDKSGSILLVHNKGEYWERVALLNDEQGMLKRVQKRRMKTRLG